MATADVTVFGAGVFGLSVAYSCARQGAKVSVIDPAGIAGGASGGIVGALAPHVPENWNSKKAFQFDSLTNAFDFWTSVAEIGGKESGYLRSGRLQPINDERALHLAYQREKSARRLWQGQAEWKVVPIDAHGDWAPKSQTGFLIHDTLTARIHPRKATQALAAAVLALGGRISHDGIEEGLLVHATGWRGLADLSAEVGKPIGDGVKGQAALLEFNVANRPQLFADALHIVPHSDGTVAIGSTSEREFDAPNKTDTQLDDIIERAVQAFPILAHATVINRWAGVRPRAKSRAPLLGCHPYKSGHFIANGGFKIGFGMAPKIGRVMADLILNDIDKIPDAFRIETCL